MKKAVVLLSGGLDSTTCLAYARSLGYEVHTVSFSYGQKHSDELETAAYNAEKFGAAAHHVINIDTHVFSGSALTDPSRKVPVNGPDPDMIPDTYVPARNTVFLSYALAIAETLDAGHIFIGVNSVDYSGYPDCRPEYIKAFQSLADLALKKTAEGSISIKIETPLIDMDKAGIIRLGKELGVDFSMTISCYDPVNGKACGKCDSCLLRKKGFTESGIKDETVYA